MCIGSQCHDTIQFCRLLQRVSLTLWLVLTMMVEYHHWQQSADDLHCCWSRFHSGYMQHQVHTDGHSIWHHQCDLQRTSNTTSDTQWQLRLSYCTETSCFSHYNNYIIQYQQAGWEINVPFQHKIGYIGDKVLAEDLLPPG